MKLLIAPFDASDSSIDINYVNKTPIFTLLLLSSLFLSGCGEGLSDSFAGTGSGSTGTGGTGGTNSAPVASNVIITDENGGDVELGDALTLSYTYTDAEGDDEGSSAYLWHRDGDAILGFTAQTTLYTPVNEDLGTTLTVRVTPVATSGEIIGSEVFSSGVSVVDAGSSSPSTAKISPAASIEKISNIGASSNSDRVLDTSHFRSMLSANIVKCTLNNGSTADCYELKFAANKIIDGITFTDVNDEAESFCPIKRTGTNGGIGLYDDAPGAGFQQLTQELWDNMVNAGYNIIDGNDHVCTFNLSMSTQTNGEQAECTANCLTSSPDDNITVVHYIPVVPENLETANTIDIEEAVGTSLDGVPMTGDPASVAANNGNIQALDSCGGHHDPSGYYHWHFVPESADVALTNAGITEVSCGSSITQSTTALTGYAIDGYPIYAHLDDGDVTPAGLDSCNGHTGPTVEFPDGVYHYHASLTAAPNLPSCLTGASVTTPVTPSFE